MIWVAFIILGIVAAFMFRASRPGTDIRRNGTEADAVVCRIEKERLVYASSYYHWPFCYAYYVKFTDGEGHEAEARLMNPEKRLEAIPPAAGVWCLVAFCVWFFISYLAMNSCSWRLTSAT